MYQLLLRLPSIPLNPNSAYLIFTYQDGSCEKNDIVAIFRCIIKKTTTSRPPNVYGQHMEPIAIDLNYKNMNKSKQVIFQ